MQERPPHEVRRFADGEPIPEGFVELTEAQAAEVERLAPAERGDWLRKNVARSALGQLGDELRALAPSGDPLRPGPFPNAASALAARVDARHGNPTPRPPTPMEALAADLNATEADLEKWFEPGPDGEPIPRQPPARAAAS